MTVISAQAFEASMINALAISDPQMNTALGTPVRKIITAVAQEMASFSIDVNVTTSLYSIDSVSGTELDYLVGQFGFARQEARAARGTITVRRDNGDSVFQIPYGSQFYRQATSTTPSVVFQTTSYQEMGVGVLSVDVAVVASVAGSIGNVPADTINNMSAQVGYMSITNANPTSGGRDAETDEQLRQRFLLTVFRNVSGTGDQMRGLALANERVDKANLIGQESRYSEICQVEKDPVSGNNHADVEQTGWDMDVDHALDTVHRFWVRDVETRDIYPHGDYVVEDGGRSVVFNTKADSDVIGAISVNSSYDLSHGDISSYTITNMETGVVISDESYGLTGVTVDVQAGTVIIGSSTNGGTGVAWRVDYDYNPFREGDFVQVEFDYSSKHSRDGLKAVDLYVDSMSEDKVTDIQYVDMSKVIDSSNAFDWVRMDGSNPDNGHLYIPLSYQPMSGMSGYVNMGTSSVLVEGVHFNRIFDATGTAGSSRGMDAIELIGSVSTSASGSTFVFDDSSVPEISDKTPLAIPYFQNGAVRKVQDLIDEQRVVTMDVLVHEAVHRNFVVYLTMMYSIFPQESVKRSVTDALVSWAEARPFGHVVQISDIETVAANVAGVDNVRLSTQADSGGTVSEYKTADGLSVYAYGMLEIYRDGKTCKRRFVDDFRLAQNEVIEILDVVFYSRSQKRWGV